jgi:acetyl/propionyl-CoA carboxylase alpha subunit
VRYRIVVGDVEIALDVREATDKKLKVARGNGYIEVQWEENPLYPLVSMLIDGKPYSFFLIRKGKDSYVVFEGRPIKLEVWRGGETTKRDKVSADYEATRKITSPLSGLVTEVMVKVGDRVKAGSPLLVLEAMKMRNEIRAKEEGEVIEILVKPGMSVELGSPLLVLRKASGR